MINMKLIANIYLLIVSLWAFIELWNCYTVSHTAPMIMHVMISPPGGAFCTPNTQWRHLGRFSISLKLRIEQIVNLEHYFIKEWIVQVWFEMAVNTWMMLCTHVVWSAITGHTFAWLKCITSDIYIPGSVVVNCILNTLFYKCFHGFIYSLPFDATIAC